MSTVLKISILYVGTVRMGCLLFFFLSFKTNTRANIKTMCKINRFDTILEKKMHLFKGLFFVVVVVLFSFLFCNF